jgi:hypothetical protein
MPMPTEWQQHVQKCTNEYLKCYPFGREYDEFFAKIVPTERLRSWSDFERWSNVPGKWGFRGQREASWTLQTSLERSIRVEYSRGDISGHYHDRQAGKMLLPNFKRRAKQYIADPPSQDDPTSYLSWMQHYGVPTRLLDWTYAPSIALYFALESASHGDAGAVWAVDLDWLETKKKETLGSHRYELFSDIGKIPLIVRVDPYERNPRLDAQRGFFLWKLVEKTPFFDQIFTDMILHPAIPKLPVIRKLDVPIKLRSELLEELRRINVTRTTLFPPDGYSAPLGDLSMSLKQDLESAIERQRYF